MKKNGFTLTELLGAIVILAMLSLIAIPAVTNTVKSSKQKLYDVQIKNIRSAAKAWVADNLESMISFDEGSEECMHLPISTLANEGYLENNIKNPKTNESFDENYQVDVCKIENSKNYNYTVTDITN